MKKTTLTSIFWAFLCLPFLVAQSGKFQFGIAASARITDATYKNKEHPPIEVFFNESYTWRFSTGCALWCRYPATDRLGIQMGIGFDISGYRVKEFPLTTSTPTMPEPVEIGKVKGTVHYYDFTLPVSLRWKPGKSDSKFYLTAGAAPMMKVSRKQTVIIHFNTGEVSKSTVKIPENNDQQFNDFNLRGDAGFGYYIWTSGRFRIYAEPHFSYTLFPVYTGGGGKMRQWYLGINIGIDL